ncbi:MAG: DNA polymerase [Firmicutes bacterium]|nr:DNA polymerase [Bacillota bacterium]
MKSFKDDTLVKQMGEALARGQLAQALLLSGSGGVLDEAVEHLAKALLCEAERAAACRCRSCRTAPASHPDVAVVSPESKASISRDQVATAVGGVLVRPLWSPAKVVVIRPAEALSREAESYLLKHLEEPPPYAYYLLVTEQPDALLPTIRSRCQHWRFSYAMPERGEDESLELEPVTLEHVLQLAYTARRRYLVSGQEAWLRAWETLQTCYRNLEANANPDLVLAQIKANWPRENAPRGKRAMPVSGRDR